MESWVSLTKARAELKDTKELLEDPEMREMAQEEYDHLVQQVEVLQKQLRMALIPPDPYEGRDILVEIRAGTGGDEAGLFAGDLFRMYIGIRCKSLEDGSSRALISQPVGQRPGRDTRRWCSRSRATLQVPSSRERCASCAAVP